MTSLPRLSYPLPAAFALAFVSTAAQAIVDQENTGFVAGGVTIDAGPIGQSFVPALSSIDFAEFQVNDQNAGFGSGDYIAVNVRSGTIDGTILGTSATVFFPDQPMTSGDSPPQIVHFDFAAPVPLTPGRIYILEAFRPDTTAVPSDLGFFGTGFNNDTYAEGTAFVRGAVFAGANAPFDLWFREGTSVPLPAAAWLLAPALAVLGLLRRRNLPT